MADIKKKRKEIETLVYGVMFLLDPRGYNKSKYERLFKSMSDTQFSSWMKKLFSDDDNNFTLETTPFVDGEVDLGITNIKKAADYLGVPLDEYIYMPFMNPDGAVIRSREKTPVGYIFMKRLEQILSKKNSHSSEITQRNSKTGQVVGDDKNSRISDMENYALLALGAEEALKEFMGPRADDITMKQDMLKDIARDGYTSLRTMENSIDNKTALNTLNTYYLASGIMTDLVSPGYTLRRNLNNKEVKDRIQDKYN